MLKRSWVREGGMSNWTIDQEVTTGYLQALVRMNSINPGLAAGGAGEGEVAAWLLRTCEGLGFEVRSQETAPGRPNIIARWPGNSGGQSLLLTGHTDVVSIENMSGDPFDGRIEDGKLYGRGAYDMKGGLASILGAVEALKRGGFQPAGDLWLGFVTDEEYLSIGMDALVKEIQPDAAILTEPTEMQLCIAHKGFAWLTISTEGRAAHGSRYDQGVDAIVQMGRVLAELGRLESEVFPQHNHALLGRPSVHASLVSGGLGLSTYPDACRLQIEHRLLPDETGEEVVWLWESILEHLALDDHDFRGSVKLDFERPGFEIEADAPIVRCVSQAFESVMNRSADFMGQYAWLDSAILSRAGIPTIILGPGGAGAHAAVEYVHLEDVFGCAAVIAEAAARWFRP
jgi:acetylornithine deacetylase